MFTRRATSKVATSLLFTAVGVAIGVLWAARRQPAEPVVEALKEAGSVRRVPPNRNRADEGEPTAMPRATSPRFRGADDYESIGPDDLTAAFLLRATDSLDESASVPETELDGFQIATIEELTAPDLSDDPADFEIPSQRIG
jgi:hypothetical protein